jgi:hypothetical protein
MREKCLAIFSGRRAFSDSRLNLLPSNAGAPDRARTFLDMCEAVAWARQHPRSAIYSILAMDDDLPDQVYVSRLARTMYDRRANK